MDGTTTQMLAPKRCKRPPLGTPADVMGSGHAAKMQMKRAMRRSGVLVAGFTPVPNARVDHAITAAMLLVQMQRPHLTAAEVQQEALSRVAKTLPAPRPFRHLFPRPSKNDSAAYRRGNRA